MVLATACLFSGITFADDDKPHIVLGLVAFPPLSEISPQSSICTGQAVETLRNIFIDQNYNITAICAPAARIYRLIEKGEIDMTVNVQSTEALKNYVSFFSTPYVTLTLLLVTNESVNNPYIAAIRGFDYHGIRHNLSEQGMIFSDVPSANDAINLFTRQRTRHLITYQRPYNAFLANSRQILNGNVSMQRLAQINTYIAVSNVSPLKRNIFEVLENYVHENAVTIFIDDPVDQLTEPTI